MASPRFRGIAASQYGRLRLTATSVFDFFPLELSSELRLKGEVKNIDCGTKVIDDRTVTRANR